MLCFPNAKINLGLNIVSKRKDGYHNLETVFYPITVCDALEIVPATNGRDSFTESGISVDVPSENNLVMKALRLVGAQYDIPPMEVHLLKKIPFGAGIGGGSADAAFMLKLLNSACNLNMTDDEMAGLALKLGADCPFFIYNRPMFASGIGEALEDVTLSLDGYTIVLVKPDVHIPTRDAFAQIVPRQPENPLKEIIRQPLTEWKKLMFNDFERSIFPQYPVVGEIKRQLYRLGAAYASMSGSGSSVYGIFEHAPENIQSVFNGCYTWQSATNQ
ncbi:MAG: 4-(cytidine 5'-diphospho)-2-C-methyl-D-erythritol kinase [Prevotella sp.]|jgi:4-diphosphocytidyl-2-C-methyl-D-erythritol kinase|nr:4-(cytidine 5'-diphospho)-2-C-methyl-D-erythritol kinase [Prevotella sp.]